MITIAGGIVLAFLFLSLAGGALSFFGFLWTANKEIEAEHKALLLKKRQS